MAHLWRSSDAGEWQPIALDADFVTLDDVASPRWRSSGNVSGHDEPTALIRRAASPGDEAWVLLAAPDARVLVNGRRVDLGIIVLADRDEIRSLSASPLYFSTERIAEAAPCPGTAPGFCPRCKDVLDAGQMAVRCPGCGLWHHATGERPCWTYGEQCAACPQPTTPDAGFRWTPEEL